MVVQCSKLSLLLWNRRCQISNALRRSRLLIMHTSVCHVDSFYQHVVHLRVTVLVTLHMIASRAVCHALVYCDSTADKHTRFLLFSRDVLLLR